MAKLFKAYGQSKISHAELARLIGIYIAIKVKEELNINNKREGKNENFNWGKDRRCHENT